MSQVPNAPTFKEAGYDLEAYAWYALGCSRRTPREAVERLEQAVNDVLVREEVAKAQAMGMEPRAVVRLMTLASTSARSMTVGSTAQETGADQEHVLNVADVYAQRLSVFGTGPAVMQNSGRHGRAVRSPLRNRAVPWWAVDINSTAQSGVRLLLPRPTWLFKAVPPAPLLLVRRRERREKDGAT